MKHKLVRTVMRMDFQKSRRSMISYRSYKALIRKTSWQANITNFSNNSMERTKFFKCLKLANIIPFFGKIHAHLKSRQTNKYIASHF